MVHQEEFLRCMYGLYGCSTPLYGHIMFLSAQTWSWVRKVVDPIICILLTVEGAHGAPFLLRDT